MPDKKIQGEALFSFALVADTHIQSPHDRPSQWKTNNLAAERSRLAYEQMAATSPPFIVHLGDVTNPVPHAPTFDSACHAAKELIRTADTKTFIVAGNHDVGDKMSRIVPNHPIDDYSIRKFENHWGSSWQSWDYKDVHFLIINSSLVGSGLPQEREQLEFVESDLRDHSNKRTFLFSHYPLFMENPDEVSLYDNIEPKGRSALLKMLDQHHIEAAIAGHVHNFFYNTYGGTEMYGLLSTTFVRHDYAELFPTAPADEYGRNDTPKLAWAQITVFESGHALRTNRLLDPVVNYLDVHDLHPKQYTRSALGVNLRDAWAEAKPLMYMGPVDEFERRKVRNDYLLVALWETGIRHLRIPLRDLLRPDYVARIQDLVGIGHTFTAFVVDVPQGDLLEGLKRHESLLSGLEVILPWQEIDAHVPKIEALINIVDIPIYLACISSATDHRNKAYQFSYFMSYGFYADEIEMLKEAHERFGRRLGLAYAFRIGADESPVAAGTTIIQEFSEKEGIPVTINVASLSTIADLRDDEVAATTRAVETTLLGLLGGSREGTKVFLETLVDVEKGYNPSIGLYDALYNPRSGARATANLQMLLKDTPITIESLLILLDLIL
ncbi:hypothetical protein CEP54_001343 [Fusarium duplospermum]|uniref:Calcineurin-like phosphoesterase domain-containing protein n=1 Tax=Fusarium duplospermum TaxID=1325734 RepID=A0A428R215_9HYPO|nr:hypothetical protein CEP54_001343 [Fusarium duplospermum]